MVVQGVRSLVTSSVPVRGGGRGAHGDALLLAGGGHDVGRDGQRLLELLGEIAGARCARTFLYERLFSLVTFHAHTLRVIIFTRHACGCGGRRVHN